MKKTANYDLNQWEKSDRIMMEDFNADNAKIDAALLAEATARDNAIAAEAAARAAADAAFNDRCRIVYGTYTGTGGNSVSITCGFRPRMLFLACDPGGGMVLGGPYDGSFGVSFQLYVEGVSILNTYIGGDTNSKTTFTPHSSGIFWSNNSTSEHYIGRMAMNEKGKIYRWVALG